LPPAPPPVDSQTRASLCSVPEEVVQPEVSVVIIGRNEGPRLARCLTSVEAMQRPAGGVEVIYVDSGSSDDSAKIAETAGVGVVRLQPEWPTAALARNAGWRLSRGPYVLFIDGDSEIDPEFLTRALPAFDDAKVAAITGEFCERHSDTGFFDRVLALDWTSRRPGHITHCSGNALVRRSALDAVNGYDENLISSEEPEMCYRMRGRGYVILYLDVPMAVHELGITRWAQYFRRCQRVGYGFAEVSARFRKAELDFEEGRVRSNRFWGAFLVLLPITALVSAVAMSSWLPVAFVVVAVAVLVSWNALRLSPRVSAPGTSLLYGVHWVTKQIPMLMGQLRYLYNRHSGRRARLIEYK
jgi:glycosyltransferase involved in cell wall biosynthesis